jgi:hypothetical protein
MTPSQEPAKSIQLPNGEWLLRIDDGIEESLITDPPISPKPKKPTPQPRDGKDTGPGDDTRKAS